MLMGIFFCLTPTLEEMGAFKGKKNQMPLTHENLQFPHNNS